MTSSPDRDMLQLCRFTLGRWLVHAGIKTMPKGRVRAELTDLLNAWGRKVRTELAQSRIASKGGGGDA